MIDKLNSRMRREEGWLVVTAIAVITMMVGIGLAIFSTVDTQQSMSRQERNRDSAFNLAESALYAQAFILSRNWPFQNAPTHPTSWVCTQTVTTDGTCPSYTSLQNALDGTNIPDLKSGIQWKLTVTDNGKPGSPTTDYITDPSDPNYTNTAYDANGDNRLWVRADGWAQGKERSMVALLQLEQFSEPFPHNVVTAGHFQTDNNGNKVLINTKGDSATGSQVVVHCPQTQSNCASLGKDGQVNGPIVYSPPPGGDSSQIPTAMTPSQLARFQAVAQNNGTYYTSCPTDLTGSVVFIDFPSYSPSNECMSPSYTGNATWNSPTSPGLLIIRNGILSLGGNTTYYGLVYAANPSCTSDNLVLTQGNTHIFGGVAVDCLGGLDIGESQENVTFLSKAFDLKTTGAAGLVQNTWRELPAGTP